MHEHTFDNRSSVAQAPFNSRKKLQRIRQTSIDSSQNKQNPEISYKLNPQSGSFRCTPNRTQATARTAQIQPTLSLRRWRQGTRRPSRRASHGHGARVRLAQLPHGATIRRLQTSSSSFLMAPVSFWCICATGSTTSAPRTIGRFHGAYINTPYNDLIWGQFEIILFDLATVI